MLFKPERHITKDGGRVSFCGWEMPVFLCGPRECLGREMAHILVLVFMLLRFVEVFAIVEVLKGEPCYENTLTLWTEKGVDVRLKERG